MLYIIFKYLMCYIVLNFISDSFIDMSTMADYIVFTSAFP